MVTFVLVCMAWILFRVDNLQDAMTMFGGMFTKMGMPAPEYAIFMSIALAMAILLVKEFSEEFNWKIRLSQANYLVARHIYLILMMAYILLFGVLDGGQFIYFQF